MQKCLTPTSSAKLAKARAKGAAVADTELLVSLSFLVGSEFILETS